MKRLMSIAALTVAALVTLTGCTGRSHADPTDKPSEQQVRLYDDANGQLVEADFCDGHGNRIRVAFQNGATNTAVATTLADPNCKV